MAQSIAYLCVALYLIIAVRGPNPWIDPKVLQKKAFDAHGEWRPIWDSLLNLGEIEKTTRKDTGGHDTDMYKLNGDLIKRMQLSDAFKLLQNWNHIDESVGGGKNTFFELNIGGEDYIFRLRKDKNHQIMVADSKGSSRKYDKIFDVFNKQETINPGTQDEIAGEIYDALNRRVGDQKAFTSAGGDPDILKAMRDLMTIGLIAESASMSDELYDHMKEKFDKLRKLDADSREKSWAEQFKEQNRKDYETAGDYEKLKELMDELKENEILFDQNAGRKEPSETFSDFQSLVKEENRLQDHLKELFNKLGGKEMTEEQYKNIEEATEVLSNEKSTPDEIKVAKKKIRDNIGETFSDFQDLIDENNRLRDKIKLLFNMKRVEKMTEKQYKNIEEATKVLSNKKSTTDERNLAKKKIRDNIPKLNDYGAEVNRLKKDISEALPKPSDAFFEGLKDAAGDKKNQRKRTEEVFEKLGVKQLIDDQYNKVKEAADTLLKSTDTNAIKKAKKTILENIPELADESFDELNRLAEEPFTEAQTSWKKFIKPTLKRSSRKGDIIKKAGRSPGQDILFRDAVRYMFENPASSKGRFKEVFRKLFRIHLDGGTNRAREELYADRLNLRDDVEEAEHSRKKFKGQLDMKAAASGRAASDSIKKIVDDSIGGACGSTMMAFSSQ